jgi:REP element-mobilizing transposase RayT
MPYKNKNKINKSNAYYHAYNRGFKKDQIFHTESDYKSFTNLIACFSSKFEIEIIAFCLMPNHYHFLIKQKEENEMGKFFQRLNSSYSRIYNTKYDTYGQLWEGTYKANFIRTTHEFETILFYIHQNPRDIVDNVKKYPHSSFSDYLGSKKHYKFIKRVRPNLGD